MSGNRGLLAAVLDRLLRVYPVEFRDRFAEDMTREFSRRRDDAERRGFVALHWFALRTFAGITLAGALERSRSRGRSRRPRRRMEMRTELRHAFLTLAKAPAFTILAVLTLGLGIAVTTTLFSLVSALLFAESPVKDPERMVFLWGRNERAGENRSPLTLPEVADLREEIASFESVAMAVEESFEVSSLREAGRAYSFRVTDNFFEVWGVGTVLGRGFLPGEDRPGAAPVALLSHGFWERELGSDPGILGATGRPRRKTPFRRGCRLATHGVRGFVARRRLGTPGP